MTARFCTACAQIAGIARFEVPQNAASLEFDWIIDMPFRVVHRLLYSIVQIELEASWKSAERFELGRRHSCSLEEEPQGLMVRIDVFGLGEQGDKLLSRDPVDCFRKYARQRGDPLDIWKITFNLAA